MRFLYTAISTTLAARLRSVRGWLVLLLLPALLLGANLLLPRQEAVAPVQVGVCLPKRGAEAFWELLESRGGTVMTFLKATEEEIDRNVASGNWDCGLILPRDFEERLEDLETEGLIALRIGSGSVAYPLVREAAAASLAQLMSPVIAEEYLLESGIVSDKAQLKTYFRMEELSGADRVRITLSTPDGRALEPLTLAQKSVIGILQWILSASLLVWMILSAADLGRWSASGAAMRLLPMRGRTWILLSRIGADAVLALAAGLICQLLLSGGLSGCLAVLGYVLLWMSVAVVLARNSAVWKALPMCMSAAVVLSLLLSGVLVDPGWFPWGLGTLAKLLPVSLFLAGCDGSVLSALALVTISGIILALSLAADAYGKRSPGKRRTPAPANMRK